MVTKKQLEEAIININHSSDIMKDCLLKGFARTDVQHNDMLGEMKRTNDNWFKLSTKMLTIFVLVIIGVFALVGVKLGGLI